MEAAFQQGFASALLEVLFSRVTDVILNELKKIKNVDEAVQNLETTILKAQDRLRKIDTLQYQGNCKTVLSKRVATLTTLCYDAEDVMDEIALMIAKRNSKSGKKTWRVRDVILRSLRTWTMPHGISKLQEKLSAILEQLKDLTDLMSNGGCMLSNMETFNEDDKYVKQIRLIGREKDVDAIIEELISCHPNNGVSIIGMRGIGKTVLAQTILNDARIVSTYPVRLWYPVSQRRLDTKEIFDKLANLSKGIETQLGATESSNSHLILNQSKNLIVFDNLLELQYIHWDDLWSVIKSCGETKFLITTHDPSISKLTDTFPYYLRSLSEECCKNLIMEKASLHNQMLSGKHFSSVAGLLASKCEGLPLVARIIGLVLAKCDEDKWNTLAKVDLWEWPVFKEEIFPVLHLSYKDMQPDLRNCFAFFSLFPYNHRFHLDDLVKLWLGAGFIQHFQGTSSLEQIGRTYLNALLSRSILQICDDVLHVERSRTFELHKFNQKFAELAASKTCLRLDKGVSPLPYLDNDTRHLSLVREAIEPTLWSQMRSLKRLHTILTLYAEREIGRLGRIPPSLFKAVDRLRVLALSNTNVAELPDSVDRLKYLRYLDVSGTLIQSLPETLSKLHCLQILKFSNTPNLYRLPKDMHNLTDLVFLDWDVSNIENLGLPYNIGSLHKLENLPLFPVGQKEGCLITELQNMNNLNGSMRLKNLENVKDMEEAMDAMLHKKLSLKRIELQWNSSSKDRIAKYVLEGLKPSNSLKELKIIRYGGAAFPEWIGYPFFMLVEIYLQKCHSCIVFPALGQLPALKILVVQEMSCLTTIDHSLVVTNNNTAVDNFPSLERLEFDDMSKLQFWKGLDTNCMMLLRELKLMNCPALISFPSLEYLTSMVDLQIEDCQALESLPNFPISLKSLIIRDSPKVKDQCHEGGTEWPKIDHVVHVEIDFKIIPTSGVLMSASSSTS
ncbi:unnamed protein product [Amaranthus hypochondriacus]